MRWKRSCLRADALPAGSWNDQGVGDFGAGATVGVNDGARGSPQM